MVLRAKKQLILVKIIDFTPLVPQKSSVESSINDYIQQKSTFRGESSTSGKMLAEAFH